MPGEGESAKTPVMVCKCKLFALIVLKNNP